jgi:hypothetical protein
LTFFDKYSFQQKNYALAILTVLLIAVAYKKAFSISLDTIKYQTELTDKVEKASHADQDIRSNQIEIMKLDRFLGKENSTVEKVQQGFLNFFAEKAKNIAVHQIDEVLNFKHPDYEINTHSIVLKGDYLSTLNFIYALETDFPLGKILNITFEYKRPSSEDNEALYTTLLMQNYLR